MDRFTFSQSSPDDDLIEYSVKRWAPFVCRDQRRIVSTSTDDILHEYARRLGKPISELIDRYRKIHNSRRRHRPKRGLSLIWNVATNRPRVLFYWTSGRSHFWCCDPLQICPARFLGGPNLSDVEIIEKMVDYSLNVLSYFDPSPVIEGARRNDRLPENMFTLYDDEDSSASEETFQPTPSSSRTPLSSIDDPIIPFRPEESSSDIVLSESDQEVERQPLSLIGEVKSNSQILYERSDIDNIIASIQESRPLIDSDLIRTVETVRHRSIFSPRMTIFSPLIPTNITFPANVRPVPVEFEIPRPPIDVPRLRPLQIDAEMQTEPLSQDSMLAAQTQNPPIASQATTVKNDMSLVDLQQWLTQPDESQQQPSQSQSSRLAYWTELFPFLLHFCRKQAEPFEARSQFQFYIRFDYEAAESESPRRIVASAMHELAPSALIDWIANESLVEAPFVSDCNELYALVPLSEDRGVCLCMNEAAWFQFGTAALLETKRRKAAILKGPIESAQTWIPICKRFTDVSYLIDRFHDDIIEALIYEETVPDNSALQPTMSTERRPASPDRSQPEGLSAETKASHDVSMKEPEALSAETKASHDVSMKEPEGLSGESKASHDVSMKEPEGLSGDTKAPHIEASMQIDVCFLAEPEGVSPEAKASHIEVACPGAESEGVSKASQTQNVVKADCSQLQMIAASQAQSQTINFLMEIAASQPQPAS